ncbi:MAG: hypothetical protein IPP94_18220 [Ignavibacteria bacterium]|nr:hypothetical protein [Ignavibacteria bacterium]
MSNVYDIQSLGNEWDGSDDASRRLPSGSYLLPLTEAYLKIRSSAVHELTPNPSLGKRGAFQFERHFVTTTPARASRNIESGFLFLPLPFSREGGWGDEFVATPNVDVTSDDNGTPSNE